MVEYIKLEKNKPKVLTDKQRTHLILFTYILNFNLYVILFNVYENFFLKWLTFFLITAFALQMLSRQTSISGINGWTIVFAIINFFVFGFTSLMFSFNILVICVNLLYFKYILKRINLNENG